MAHKKSKNDKEKIFLEEFDGFTPGIEGYVGFLELELKKCSEKLNIVPKIEIRVLEIEKRLSRIQDINGRLDTRLLEFETKISDLSERSLKLEKSFEKALPSFKPIKNLLSQHRSSVESLFAEKFTQFSSKLLTLESALYTYKKPDLLESRIEKLEYMIEGQIARRLNELDMLGIKKEYSDAQTLDVTSIRKEFNVKMASLVEEMQNMVTLEDFEKIKKNGTAINPLPNLRIDEVEERVEGLKNVVGRLVRVVEGNIDGWDPANTIGTNLFNSEPSKVQEIVKIGKELASQQKQFKAEPSESVTNGFTSPSTSLFSSRPKIKHQSTTSIPQKKASKSKSRNLKGSRKAKD